MRKKLETPPPTPEEELDEQINELLAAIDASRRAAGVAYGFSGRHTCARCGTACDEGGSAYAYGVVQACIKVATLAKRILGNGQT